MIFRLTQRHLGLSKFRQDGSYKKKHVSAKSQIQNDWRKLKGFDRRKGDVWCKCGRYLKSWGNRKHRRWERKMIVSGRYSEIYWHQDRFVSSWDAC